MNEDKLIVALDVPDIEKARALTTQLQDTVNFYKIGYQLAPIGGFDLAGELIAAGKKVFLDLKYHDIGATVERGVVSVRKAGADFLTVHAEPDVLAGAVEGRGDDPSLKILAVTVLTSLDQAALARAGINTPIPELVLQRAEFAAKAGADGVIASAQEAPAIKSRFGRDLLIVTPGIRPAGGAENDQKRVVTPAKAVNNGADYLVVGRPIIGADDPVDAARSILRDIAAAAP